MYVNYVMLSFFCITCSICRQHLYIKLLFLCIGHLKWWWKYLEWKQGLQSRQCYLPKQTSCWLQRAPQRRIQRLMTSPISPPEVYDQTWQGYITHVMHVVLHCLVFTSYMDFHLLTCLLYKSYIWIISCHHVYIHNIYLNYGMATHLMKTSYSYIISSCLVFIVIIFWIMSFYPWIIMPSCFHRRHVCDLWHANHFNRHIV